MDPACEHLADACFRFTGSDGSVDLACSRFALFEHSGVLRQAFGSDVPTKRTAEGVHILPMTNERFTTKTIRDCMVYIHQGVHPRDHDRIVDMLEPMDWLDVRCGSKLLEHVMDGVIEKNDAAMAMTCLRKLERVPESVIGSLTGSLTNGSKMYYYIDGLLGVVHAKGLLHIDDPVDVPMSTRKLNALAKALESLARGSLFETGVACIVNAMLHEPTDVWRWLRETAVRPITAARLALCVLPPVAVALGLVAQGALDEDAYDYIVDKHMSSMTLPDFAALACCTDLARKKHPDMVAMALRPQTTTAKNAPNAPKPANLARPKKRPANPSYSAKLKMSTVVSHATARLGDSVVGDGVVITYKTIANGGNLVISMDRNRGEFKDRGAVMALVLTKTRGNTPQEHTFYTKGSTMMLREPVPRGPPNPLAADECYIVLVPQTYCNLPSPM